MIKLGVPDFAAHMFIFYYALLSEVSPPTALSPFAAAAITGGNPYRTTLQSWKYTLPAFLVPFAFVLDPDGVGLLLKGSPANVVEVVATAAIGIAALACGVQGWMFQKTSWIERAMLIAGGILLMQSTRAGDLAGIALVLVATAIQWSRWRRVARAAGPGASLQ